MAGKFPACDEFLSPLMTGLEICLTGPHQWDVIKSYCLQIVECYGNQSLYMDADMGSRLKNAVMFLITAARVDNMKFDVERNILGVLESTSLTNTSCQEDISALLLAVTSSSVFGCDSDSLTSKAVNAAPAGAAAKGGKAKKGEAAAPVTKASSPTARDALLMLSSFAREVDPFWCDGNEYAVLFDLTKKTSSSFDSFNSKYFLSTLPSTEEELVVTEGSVTSLWFPSARNAISDRTSLFAGATGYFLLGGFKDSGDRYTSTEPFLTKVEVDRLELAKSELHFRRVGERIDLLSTVEAEYHHGASMKIAEELAELLKRFFFFVRGGPIGKKDAELVSVTPVHQEAEGKYFVRVDVSGAEVATIPMSSDVMLAFATAASQERACFDLKCHKSVALFFWAALKS